MSWMHLDGLPDAWEFSRYGKLTALSGSGDWDKDGVTDGDDFRPYFILGMDGPFRHNSRLIFCKEKPMYSASDLKKGLKIEIDGDPCVITDFQFSKPGKGQAIYRCKIRNLGTGNSFEKSFRSADKVEKAALESRDYTFSYENGGDFIFSDNETFEEIHLSAEQLGDNRYFIVEDMQVEILFHNNKALDITLPNFVEKMITDTEPGARGDTTTNCNKPARIDNGYEIAVPIFINEGDVVRIDTRTGQYADRVSKG